MKPRIALLLCPAVLGLSVVVGRAQPLARVTFSNFNDLSNAIVRVASAASPGAQSGLGADLTRKLGLTDLSTFDSKGAWEFAVWKPADSPMPLMALKCPTPDIKKFRSKLSEGGLLAGEGNEGIQLGKGAAIIFKPADQQTDGEKAELKRWEDEALVAPKHVAQLTLAPSEEVRAQILPVLAMVKMSMSQGAAAAGGNANPKAVGEMFDIYFGAVETFIKGFQDLKVSADVTPDAILVEEAISAKPGSDFAAWIHKPAIAITAEDLKEVNPEAMFSGAMTIGKEPQLVDLMRKFVRLSVEMQNLATNDASADELGDLISKCLPVCICGSVSFKGHFDFSGAYRFPQSDVTAFYGQMKAVMAKLVKTQAGEGKMYSEASFTEKHHTVAGVPVDRYSFKMNLDNPVFQRPGQKQQFEAMFPNGKMEIDYAVKNDRLLLASPERMQSLIEGKGTARSASGIIPTDSTVAAGYFNLLAAIRDLGASNPMVPPMVKEKMSKLDPSGGAVQVQVEMNSQIAINSRVPLTLIQQLGKMH